MAWYDINNNDNGKGILEQKHMKKVVANMKGFEDDFIVQLDRYNNSQRNMI